MLHISDPAFAVQMSKSAKLMLVGCGYNDKRKV